MERGAYPEALRGLVPEYLPEMPIDAFTGEPYEYAREANGVVVSSGGKDVDEAPPASGDRLMEWRLPS
jgi:hypothetical protein